MSALCTHCYCDWPARASEQENEGAASPVEGKVQISPWHDVPLKNDDGTLNMLVEIPKWSRKKFEISTSEPFNPIKQDVKNGLLREYQWGDMICNYGAFPQTYEDPEHTDPNTGCKGEYKI